jgi:dihydrofolate reductase
MITLIAAHDKNQLIGGKNKLLWHLPKDLMRFKKLTSGHPIIMGRKTFESIGKALPNRTNIVITRNKKWNYPDVLVSSGISEAIKMANDIDENIFIIGGAEIYKQGISYCSNLEITEVHGVFKGDTWLCSYKNDFFETSRESHEIDEKHIVGFDFVQYQQK